MSAHKVIALEQTEFRRIEDGKIGNMLEAHAFASVFPMMTEAELAPLAQNIAENGLRDAIVTYTDKVLDGRNRLAACRQVKVEPSFTEFEGTEAEALAFVVSRNLHRRHLTAGQRAAIADELADMKQGARTDLAQNDARSQSEAAELLNVGRRSLQKARVVRTCDAELAAKVKSGDITLEKAYQETRATKPVRRARPLPRLHRAPKKEWPSAQSLLRREAERVLGDVELGEFENPAWEHRVVRSVPGFEAAVGEWMAARLKAAEIVRVATEKFLAFAATAPTTPIPWPPRPGEIEPQS